MGTLIAWLIVAAFLYWLYRMVQRAAQRERQLQSIGHVIGRVGREAVLYAEPLRLSLAGPRGTRDTRPLTADTVLSWKRQAVSARPEVVILGPRPWAGRSQAASDSSSSATQRQQPSTTASYTWSSTRHLEQKYASWPHTWDSRPGNSPLQSTRPPAPWPLEGHHHIVAASNAPLGRPLGPAASTLTRRGPVGAGGG